jgi:SAM-dependent methyltransferase
MLPTTTQLLDRVGLIGGIKCLDVGCGGGHAALLMARMVGPDGRVIGTDTDGEILALARNDAEAANIANVEFQQVDACASFWQEEFDMAYARFLLSHLQTPANCLATMVAACRPGGTIVIEDTDFSGSFCYPHCAAYERYNELYQEVVQRRGGDPNIGPKLPALLRRAGIQGVEFNVIQPAHIQGEGKLMAPITMTRISDALIGEGLASKDEVQQILTGLHVAAADSETVMSLPGIFQVWGKRSKID